MLKRLLVVLMAALAFLASPVLAQTFPKLTGRVVDSANLLSPADEAELTAELAALEQRSSRQLVVATVPSLGGYEIEDYGYRLGRAWGIGQQEVDSRCEGAIRSMSEIGVQSRLCAREVLFAAWRPH